MPFHAGLRRRACKTCGKSVVSMKPPRGGLVSACMSRRGMRLALSNAMRSTSPTIAPPTLEAADDEAGGKAPRWAAVFKAALSTAVIALLVWTVGWRELGASFRSADARWLAAGLMATFAGNLLAAERWCGYVRALGQPLQWRVALGINARALTVNTLLPGALLGGDVLRVWRLKGRGCAAALAVASVMLDRAAGLFALLAAGAAAAPWLEPSGRFADWHPAFEAIGRWGDVGRAVASLVLGLALLLPLMWLEAGAGVSATSVAASMRGGARWRRFGRHAFWALATQACFILSLACGARAFGLGLPMGLLVLTAVPIFLAAALPASVGGWGTREAAAVAVWGAMAGGATSAAFAGSIAYGLFGVLAAAASVPLWRLDSKPS